MNPRLYRVLRWVSFPLFYLFALAIFFYLTFPTDRLKDRIVSEFNSQQTGSNPMRMDIEDVGTYWFSGIQAKGVHLTSTSEAPTEEGKPTKPHVVTLERIHARVSLLRLLVGTTHVNFGGDAFGGDISGYTSNADDARTVYAELENVSVADMPMLTDVVGLPLTGVLNGTIDLRMPGAKLGRAEGKIDLKITGLSVGDGKAKIRDTIALPKLDAGELVLEASATEGRLKIDKLTAKGADVELAADGRIRLRDPFDTSLAELSLRFKFSDAYTNKNDVTRGLFGAPGSSMPGLFDLDPKNKRAKRSDGFYGWRITGPLSHLSYEPSPTAAAPSGAPAGAARGLPKR